ncbi:MAG: hypothetical protein A2X49_05730 [Lentisphaerae bacterium GWF2_52_8]|nr:MAG: hypothetical protein A2X49_05730 [Lentisphaerae bacterium GWF2_52_8]
MANYKYAQSGNGIIRISDGAMVPIDASNKDYQYFLASVETPDPADPEPEVQRCIEPKTILDRLDAAGLLDTALAALDAPENRKLKAYWDALTVGVEQDDQQVRGFLIAIDANPDEILA